MNHTMYVCVTEGGNDKERAQELGEGGETASGRRISSFLPYILHEGRGGTVVVAVVALAPTISIRHAGPQTRFLKQAVATQPEEHSGNPPAPISSKRKGGKFHWKKPDQRRRGGTTEWWWKKGMDGWMVEGAAGIEKEGGDPHQFHSPSPCSLD